MRRLQAQPIPLRESQRCRTYLDAIVVIYRTILFSATARCLAGSMRRALFGIEKGEVIKIPSSFQFTKGLAQAGDSSRK